MLALSPILYETLLNNLTVSLVFQSLLPIINCSLLILISSIPLLYSMSTMFIVYHSLYEMMYVVVVSRIARKMKKHSETHFSIIFTINAFVANFYQVIYQLVIGKMFLSLSVNINFILLGSLSGFLGISYIFILIVQRCFFSKYQKDLTKHTPFGTVNQYINK